MFEGLVDRARIKKAREASRKKKGIMGHSRAFVSQTCTPHAGRLR